MAALCCRLVGGGPEGEASTTFCLDRPFPHSHTELITSTTTTARDSATHTVEHRPSNCTQAAAIHTHPPSWPLCSWSSAGSMRFALLSSCCRSAERLRRAPTSAMKIRMKSSASLVAVAAGTVPNRPLPSQCRPRRPRSRNSLSANRRRRSMRSGSSRGRHRSFGVDRGKNPGAVSNVQQAHPRAVSCNGLVADRSML